MARILPQHQAKAPAPITRAKHFLKLRREVEELDHVGAMIGKHHRGNGIGPMSPMSTILMALSGSMPSIDPNTALTG
ncbi:MAG TPA: hypothetical protein VFR52_06910 [Sphingomicrobium sp.]|nr:hypothetical protein [Sphingomicrobium sp.]